MDWIKRLNDTVAYVEQHLDGEVDMEHAARIAGCSVYNLQRMFSYIADRSLTEYIRARRMTLAAFELLSGSERVLDLALKYGYDSQDSFSRAFKGYHGVLPSMVRKGETQLRSCPRLSFRIQVSGAESVAFRIVDWPKFSVAGFSFEMQTDQGFSVIPGLWENSMHNGTFRRICDLARERDCCPAACLGIADCAQYGTAERMRYILGATTWVDVPHSEPLPPPEGMETFTYPASKWVILTADGPLPQAVQDVYGYFYNDWLPSSGYDMCDLPAIESYMADDKQEVWFAIRGEGAAERR